MIRIAITGETGFLGTHLKNYFINTKKFQFVPLGRNFQKSIDKLQNGDTLIHGASVHRNSIPEKVYEKNMEINEILLALLEKYDLSLNIIFLSSIQEFFDNPYGRSKKDGLLLFKKYCRINNTSFISHRLPNIFGPGAKPNFTSFIATFCYNIHNNIDCKYNKNIVELCYVDEVVRKIAQLSWENVDFISNKVSVEDVYFLLKEFKINMKNKKTINSYNNFQKNLIITFLSYINYKIK